MTSIDDWLARLGLESLGSRFHDNGVDFGLLPELSNDDLKDMGITRLGDRKVILKSISEMVAGSQSESGSQPGGNFSADNQFFKKNLADHDRDPTASPSAVQRRQLTVMFCDLVGSTALSTRFDPEDLREVLTSFQESCRVAIKEYEGFIARYMGDGILVYFGYPVATENSPERAIRSGLEVIRSMQSLNATTGKKFGIELQVRIGIATGPVLVGEMHVGHDAAEQAGVVGETPNLAARLQSIAAPDQLVVSPQTRQLAGVMFTYEDLGKHELKGIDRPTTVWGVIAERDVISRFSATRTGHKTPLVGRQVEMELLIELWEACKNEGGRVAMVSGEAGIGKSRLCEAFENQIAGESSQNVLLQCSPFHENTALYPVLEFARRLLPSHTRLVQDITLSDLENLLCEYAIRGVPIASLVAPFLSISTDDEESNSLNPSQRKSLLFEGIVKNLKEHSASSPLVIFVEDAHWIDPTSLELLEVMVSRLDELGVLLVITHRPNFNASWEERHKVTRISIEKLSNASVNELVDNMAAEQPLEQDQMRGILEKADGIPLFVEEMTRMLQERAEGSAEGKSHIADLHSIPDTLQGLLLARLDQLGAAKGLAQQAACFGRHFSSAHLAAQSQTSPDAIQPHLNDLIDSGLVEKATGQVGQYMFKHALVQEAAYSSLLRESRTRIHNNIAISLEAELSEHQPEIVAYHYSEAGIPDKSLALWQAAGNRAMATTAFVEASAYFSQALDELKQIQESPDRDEQELLLLLNLGDPLVATRGFAAAEVSDTFNRARDICTRLENVDLQFPVLWGLISFYIVRCELDNSLELGKQFQSLARAANSDDLILTGDYLVAASNFWRGDIKNARMPLLNFVEKADPKTNVAFQMAPTESPLTDTLSYMAWISWLTGFPDQAAEFSNRCIENARAMESHHDIAYSLGFAAWCRNLRREYSVMEPLADELSRVASEQEFPHWLAVATILKGSQMVRRGNLEEGIAQIEGGLEIWHMTGAVLTTPSYTQVLAEAHVAAGQMDKARELAESSLAMVYNTNERISESEIRRFKAEVLEKSNDFEMAREHYHQAIDVARDQGAKILELRSLVALGTLERRLGWQGESHDLIEDLYSTFTEGFDTPDLIQAKEFIEIGH